MEFESKQQKMAIYLYVFSVSNYILKLAWKKKLKMVWSKRDCQGMKQSFKDHPGVWMSLSALYLGYGQKKPTLYVGYSFMWILSNSDPIFTWLKEILSASLHFTQVWSSVRWCSTANLFIIEENWKVTMRLTTTERLDLRNMRWTRFCFAVGTLRDRAK